MKSLSTIIATPAVCDATVSPEVVASRSALLSPGLTSNNLNTFCVSLKANLKSLDNTSCFKGATSDFAQCGFLNKAEKDAYCAVNAADICCASPKDPGLEVLAPANDMFVIFGIIGASVAGLAILFCVFQKFTFTKMRPTSAYQPKKESKVASKFFSIFNGNKDVPDIYTNSIIGNKKEEFMEEDAYIQMPEESFSETGEYKVQVIEDYDAAMEDEMTLTVGDIILVNESFDDGWAEGENATTGDTGIFPMAVCEDIKSSNENNRNSPYSKRNSSLPPVSFFTSE
jgi:hypothetical protein